MRGILRIEGARFYIKTECIFECSKKGAMEKLKASKKRKGEEARVPFSPIWRHLPTDILVRILQLDGQIAYRNGKYIDRIPPDDARYKIIEKTIFLHHEVVEAFNEKSNRQIKYIFLLRPNVIISLNQPSHGVRRLYLADFQNDIENKRMYIV